MISNGKFIHKTPCLNVFSSLISTLFLPYSILAQKLHAAQLFYSGLENPTESIYFQSIEEYRPRLMWIRISMENNILISYVYTGILFIAHTIMEWAGVNVTSLYLDIYMLVYTLTCTCIRHHNGGGGRLTCIRHVLIHYTERSNACINLMMN